MSEDTLRIIVGKDYSDPKGDHLIGGLRVDFDEDTSFPSVDWRDFVVVVLCWWHEELLGIIDKSLTSGQFYFMDGPFVIDLVLQDNSDWRLIARDRSMDVERANKTVPFETVVNQILNASDAVLSACRERNWNPKEVNELMQARSRLQSIAGK